MGRRRQSAREIVPFASSRDLLLLLNHAARQPGTLCITLGVSRRGDKSSWALPVPCRAAGGWLHYTGSSPSPARPSKLQKPRLVCPAGASLELLRDGSPPAHHRAILFSQWRSAGLSLLTPVWPHVPDLLPAILADNPLGEPLHSHFTRICIDVD
jgi:hypothetical protein